MNVRKTPNGTVCGALYRGDRVEILETKKVGNAVWGRYTGGWFCITGYVTLETVGGSTEPVPKRMGKVTATLLNVRAGTGIGYAVVCQLKQGTQVEILETKVVNGTTWARISEGWVSMTYIGWKPPLLFCNPKNKTVARICATVLPISCEVEGEPQN